MAFWGLSLRPSAVTPYVPSAEVEDKVHISQACLAPDAKPGSKATVLLQVGEGTPLAICTLREGSTECMNLDLILDHYSEFTVKGNASVHLTGYFMPEYEIDGDEEDDEDYPYGLQGIEDDDDDLELDSDDEEVPGMAGRLLGFDENGKPVFDPGYDPVLVDDDYESEEDSDYETEDSEEDEEIDSEEEEEQLKQRGVVIEEITESEQANGKKAKATPAPKSNGKSAAFNEDDVDSSDTEDEEEEDGDSESEEEEKKEAVKPKGKATAAAKGTTAKKQQAGDKRKPAAEAPQPAKQPKTAEKKTPAAATKAAAKKNEPKEEPTPGSMGKDKVRRWPNGFEIQVQKQGSADGKLAKIGKKVIVKYVGQLKNGKVFDQNNKFAFRLGVGEVIKGWDRGVEGMRVGDKRKLIVPPAMGYGSSKVGPIPSNSELHFEVELIDVKG